MPKCPVLVSRKLDRLEAERRRADPASANCWAGGRGRAVKGRKEGRAEIAAWTVEWTVDLSLAALAPSLPPSLPHPMNGQFQVEQRNFSNMNRIIMYCEALTTNLKYGRWFMAVLVQSM